MCEAELRGLRDEDIRDMLRRAAGATHLDPAYVVKVAERAQGNPLYVKLLFNSGSAQDPHGKEGLTALTAAMLTDAGSAALTIEEIEERLYPIAGSFGARTDKEMTVITGVIHRDNWQRFLNIVLPIGVSEAGKEVEVVVTPARPKVTQTEYLDILRRTAGSIDDPTFVRPPQWEVRDREPLE